MSELKARIHDEATDRYRLIIKQMAAVEGMTEDLKRRSQWKWVRAINSIANRAEEIVRGGMINA